MDRAVLIRSGRGGKQTLGSFHLFENEKEIFECVTLEPPWKNNRINISCIPAGLYIVKKVISPKYGLSFQVMNVLKRSHILFHWGNLYKDTKGCILPGDTFKDIDNDGYLDVTNSRRNTELLEGITDEFILTIIEI